MTSDDESIWKRCFEEINNFEKYLVNNGIVVVKFFLNVSREAQKERFLERALMPDKNWKFSATDMKERARWDDYVAAFEDVFNHTSTEWAPWYIVPADNKWFTRLAVAAVLYNTMKNLNLAYPDVSEAQKQTLAAAAKDLEAEDGPEDKAVVKAKAKAAADPQAAAAGSTVTKGEAKKGGNNKGKQKSK